MHHEQLPEIIFLSLCQRQFWLVQGTLCNQRLERITDTKYARILRVPFKDKEGKVIQKWMSR